MMLIGQKYFDHGYKNAKIGIKINGFHKTLKDWRENSIGDDYDKGYRSAINEFSPGMSF